MKVTDVRDLYRTNELHKEIDLCVTVEFDDRLLDSEIRDFIEYIKVYDTDKHLNVEFNI